MKKQNERIASDRTETPSAGHHASLPVMEEQVRIQKERQEKGKVTVSKQVHSDDVIVSVPVSKDETDIRHVPVNQYVEQAPPPVRQEGDTLIFSVVKEEVVVQKKLILVEEIHITTRQVTSEEEHPLTLYREQINVRRDNTEHRTDLTE
jgi:uncharacterized protein (TIGR02271 family)